MLVMKLPLFPTIHSSTVPLKLQVEVGPLGIPWTLSAAVSDTALASGSP
jgi:hypothetical protein